MTREPRDQDVPDPDDEPTAAEKSHARAFGDLIDRAIAGRGMPAAMSADDRTLVEVATVIRGAAGKLDLEAARASSLIDAALVAAVDKDRPRSASLPPPMGAAPLGDAAVDKARPIARAPRTVLPWAIAGATSLAAAAAIVMLIASNGGTRAPRAIATAPRPSLPVSLRSRSADDLVGVITRDRDGDAATRIDAIYADRLDSYRELSLAPVHRKGGAR